MFFCLWHILKALYALKIAFVEKSYIATSCREKTLTPTPFKLNGCSLTTYRFDIVTMYMYTNYHNPILNTKIELCSWHKLIRFFLTKDIKGAASSVIFCSWHIVLISISCILDIILLIFNTKRVMLRTRNYWKKLVHKQQRRREMFILVLWLKWVEV